MGENAISNAKKQVILTGKKNKTENVESTLVLGDITIQYCYHDKLYQNTFL